MTRVALYPGSFDPVTNGHVDVVRQACALVLRHLELMETEGYSGLNPEPEAARRALAELRGGKWKPGRDDIHGLQDAMGWALEALSREPEHYAGATKRGRRKRQSKRKQVDGGS